MCGWQRRSPVESIKELIARFKPSQAFVRNRLAPVNNQTARLSGWNMARNGCRSQFICQNLPRGLIKFNSNTLSQETGFIPSSKSRIPNFFGSFLRNVKNSQISCYHGSMFHEIEATFMNARQSKLHVIYCVRATLINAIFIFIISSPNAGRRQYKAQTIALC